MNTLFIEILNMSFTASIAACAVILTRLLLKRAPKIFSYALWAVVLFRLVCPFSFESITSLMPSSPDPVPQSIVNTHAPSIQSNIQPIDNVVNFYLATNIPNDKDADDPPAMLGIMELGAFIWLYGFVVLLAYALFAYSKLKRKLKTATLVDGNIFESDQIASPFVLGLLKPRIYLPVGMENTATILAHERTHIKRRDYLIKPLAFLALCLHWFNPVIWLSYYLCCKDMEMSCDESVLKHSGSDIRGEYSSSMLSVSMKRSGLLSPLAFGESNTKARVRNVLRYRKPAFWISVLSIIIVLGVTVAFMTNRIQSPVESEPPPNTVDTQMELKNNDSSETGSYTVSPEKTPEVVINDDSADQAALIRTEIVSIEGFEEEIQTKLFVGDGWSLYYEFERYGVTSGENITTIYPIGDPEMNYAYATIEHIKNPSPSDTLQSRKIEAEKSYTEVTIFSEGTMDKAGFYAIHDDGKSGLWSTDDYALTVWIVQDGAEGFYVLSLWNIMEAAEGHGVRLAHMLQSFSPFTAVPEHTYFDGYDKQEVETFAGDIKRFMETGDMERLSVLISYPINVTIDGRKTPISDAGQFVELYPRIVNQDFFRAVSTASVTDMFSNYMGVMIGNGEIWFGHISGKDGLWIYAINNGPGEIAKSGEDFLNSADGEAFQAIAHSAAKALLSADAAELASYLENPDDAPRSVRGLQDILDDVEFMSLIWGSDSIRSDNEIHISYRYALVGDDSVSYVTMELVKTDDIWKVRWLGVEK